MAEMIARFKPGANVPVFAGAQITAGRFVKITGAKTTNGDYPASHCGAGEWAFGVAEMDSAPTTYPATSTDRRVNVVRPGAIARVVAGAAITVGASVQSTAAGKATTQTTGIALGKALTAALADDDIIEVELWGAPTSGDPGAGNEYVSGTQQASIADVAAVGAPTTIVGAATTIVGAAYAAVTATSPGSGADGTTPNGAQWTAAVNDITALRADSADVYTTMTALLADVTDLYTTVTAMLADITDLYTKAAADTVAINSILDVLDEYGMTA